MANTVQGKFWCFTNFDLTVDYSLWNCKYVCWGVEKCPETGNVHHQGYVEFFNNVRLGTDRSYLKKLHPTIHWEKRKGTAMQAITYCEKDGDFHEIGEKPSDSKQGKRTDLDDVKDMLKDGKGMKDIVDVCPSYQGMRMAEMYLKYKEKKRNWKPHVKWFYGSSNMGKSKRAFEEAGEDCWDSGKNLKWFEGYDAHENVVIEDFRADFCTFHELLRILDRYPYRIENKGSSRQFLAKNIWITSPYHPEDVYKNRTDEDINQLIRRIDEIVNFDEFKLSASQKIGWDDGIEVYGNTRAFGDKDFK